MSNNLKTYSFPRPVEAFTGFSSSGCGSLTCDVVCNLCAARSEARNEVHDVQGRLIPCEYQTQMGVHIGLHI